jgi:hypothetical protein
MRGWRGYFGFCETPEVLIYLTRWVRCDSGLLCGGSGRHRVVAGQHYLRRGYVRGWQVTQPAAVAALGTSLGPRLFLLGFLMRTSNRSDFRH